MAKTTPKYALPYPDPEDIPDIAGDIQKLALATESMIGKGLVSGVWGQGSMTGYPADSKLGTPIYLDSLNQLRAKPTATVKHAVDPIGSYAANFQTDPGTGTKFWVQWGPFVGIHIAPRRITSAINAGTGSGNIGNTAIGTLRSDIPKPVVFQNFVNAYVGPTATFYVDGNGQIVITTLGVNTTWGINETWSLFFLYMSQDVIAL